MRLLSKRLILLLALSLGLSQAALAGPDRDRDGDLGNQSSAAVRGPEPGNCNLGDAERDLDVNNVLARVFNTGSLFFGNTTIDGKGYLVPQASGLAPIFASGIWIGGKVNGEVQVAAARYTGFEFWPGPLNDDGTLPSADCRQQNEAGREIFNRIYKVSRSDIQNFDSGLPATVDLQDWPAAMGAPVIAALDNGLDDDGDGLIDEGTDGIDNDGDGSIDERDEQERRIDGGYDLAAGDRPEIVGDQALWWVMNDVGNVHQATGSQPLGVEVQVHAWSFTRSDALGDVTFYRYRVINKSGIPITESYLSIFSDPDLGNAVDDYIGSDTTLSLGFVYNGDNDDEGANGYGVPPATGYDFFQGPIVDSDGDGVREDTLGMTRFTYFCNGCTQPATLDPGNKEEYYNHMQGLWNDGTPLTEGGIGYQTDGPVTKFAFPGDPVTGDFWSEFCPTEGCATNPNAPGDRRLILHTGPFTMDPGVPQDIVFGIIFAQGGSNLESVTALRAADQIAQAAYDADFELPTPPPAPPLCNADSPNPQLHPGTGHCLEASEEDGQVTLVWGYPTSSENYLGSYTELNRLLPEGSGDRVYDFEGFNIYQYPTSGFPQGQRQLIATFDVVNGITIVRDERFDPAIGLNVPFVAARGTDSGIQYFLELPGLTNYTDYYYGVTAYAYIENEFAVGSRIIESAPTQITVRPSQVSAGEGGSIVNSEVGEQVPLEVLSQTGQGVITAQVVDPTKVTGDAYRVEFVQVADTTEATFTVYNIVNVTTGEVEFDGEAYFAERGTTPPQLANVMVIDGISFSVEGPEPGILIFPNGGYGWGEAVAPGGGDACPPGDESDYCALYDVDNVYHALNSTGLYAVSEADPATPASEEFLGDYAPHDFEIRFTEDGGYAAYLFAPQNSLIHIPFEVWDVGATPDDPSDDVEMIAMLFADNPDDPGVCEFNFGEYTDPTFGLPATDRIYAYYAVNDDIGPWEAYASAAVAADPDGCTTVPGGQAEWSKYGDFDRGRPLQRQILVDASGTGADISAMQGAVIRAMTTKPNLPGDQFLFDTSELSFITDDATTAEEALELIGIVPNPYFGTSAYETGNLSRLVRFTNLPELATIRIFTVSGTLVKTLTKEGPSRSLDWDLTTHNNLPIASGMYLVHVEVPGVGERVLKFGVIQRRTRIEVF